MQHLGHGRAPAPGRPWTSPATATSLKTRTAPTAASASPTVPPAPSTSPGRHGAGAGRPGGPGNRSRWCRLRPRCGRPGRRSFGLTGLRRPRGRWWPALRRIGFDYVFDTNFTADLTIMEEGSEFLERFTHRDQLPLAHVHLLLPRLGALYEVPVPAATWTACPPPNRPSRCSARWPRATLPRRSASIPTRCSCVSIMPCMAKKSECALPTMQRRLRRPGCGRGADHPGDGPAAPQRPHPAPGPAGGGV